MIAIRKVFTDLGGDLTKPEVIPDGCFKAVRAWQNKNLGHLNTRWPNYLTQDYDPHVDQVAVQRALEGDEAVIQNLTHYEHDEFIRRLAPLERMWRQDAVSERVGKRMEDTDPHIGMLRFGEKQWGYLQQTVEKRRERAA